MYAQTINKNNFKMFLSQLAGSQYGFRFGHFYSIKMPKSKALLWPSQLGWKNSEVIFIYGLCVHFDIWNQIEEKNFLHFSKNHRGDPYNLKQNSKFFKKNFFSNFIPDIKMYAQTINKYNFKNFLTILAWPQ